jgi:hypothetical protein
MKVDIETGVDFATSVIATDVDQMFRKMMRMRNQRKIRRLHFMTLSISLKENQEFFL